MSNDDWVSQKLKKQGRPWDIKRGKSVLLLLALQNDFVEKGGKLEVPDAIGQVPTIKKLLYACRNLGLPVIHVVQQFKSVNITPRMFEVLPSLAMDGLRECSHGAEIYPELCPVKGEVVIEKMMYSSFYNTQLDTAIRNIKEGIDTIILVGTITNVCVQATAFDAIYRGFKVVAVRDCCSSFDKNLHDAALTNIENVIGRVISCDEIIDILQRNKEEKNESYIKNKVSDN